MCERNVPDWEKKYKRQAGFQAPPLKKRSNPCAGRRRLALGRARQSHMAEMKSSYVAKILCQL
jgi:hypothetical protein